MDLSNSWKRDTLTIINAEILDGSLSQPLEQETLKVKFGREMGISRRILFLIYFEE